MSLADAIIAAGKIRPGPPCTIARISAALCDADAAALDAALADRAISATQIRNGLREETGEVVGRSTLERHRRGDCLCGAR